MKQFRTSTLTAFALIAGLGADAFGQNAPVAIHCQVEDGHHMIPNVGVCPDGSETSYESWSALSYSSWGRHLDWEPHSYMSFPFPMAICENGFVVDRGEDEQTPDWVESRSALVSSPEYQALLGHHTTHYLYARLLEMENAPPANVSWQYLNASWEADQCGMDVYDAYVRDYLRVAEGELASMAPEDETYTVYNLITINMYRRIGQFDEAQARLARFQADHPDQVVGDLELAFRLLGEAISDHSTEQVPIVEAED